MPTLLDNITETHTGPEPRVVTSDVQAILRQKIKPGSEDAGESVARIAARCVPPVSTRTIYRVLNPDESKPTISLEMADRLLGACDSHLAHVRLVDADGNIADYF